jgi:biopolymer transport protein ExbD
MKKAKKKRIPVKIDMTPMVDVAFLLLTFFMMTAQFKDPEPVEVQLPESHSAFKLPDRDVMAITVERNGVVHLGMDDPKVRCAVFYDIDPRDTKSYESFSRQYPDSVKLRSHVVDPANLGNLLIKARMTNLKLRTVVRAAKDAPYGPIEDIMATLQKTRITRFNLVTDMEKDIVREVTK